MNFKFLFAIVAVAVPLVSAYVPSGDSYNLPAPGPNYGLGDSYQAASGNAPAPEPLPNAEVQPSPAESARLGQVQGQIQALNANPTYNNYQNSDAIADSLAESKLASNIRTGNVNVVAPNIVDQSVVRSLFVPTGKNNHQIIATQPLPPIVVTQPGAPPAYISSGPAAVVRAAPVIYKIRPSVIYQQEVINKVPTPLSLNPVYVKVYKPGKKIDTPVAPVVQPVLSPAPAYAPAYGPAYGPSYGPQASDNYAQPGQY